MPNSPVVYSTSVEALFVRELGPRMTGRLRARLLEAGLDLGRPLEPSYPLERWKGFVREAARELYPRLPVEDAYSHLGAGFIDGFLKTFIGRATVSVLRVMGPRRGLKRISQSLRAGNNFSEARWLERGPTEVELWLNDVFADHPAFAVGLLTRGHTACGARDVVVDALGFDGTAATLRVRWTEEPERRAAPGSSAAPGGYWKPGNRGPGT